MRCWRCYYGSDTIVWMINPVTGDPMKVTKQQIDDIERSRRVSPTSELLSSVTQIAGSTGGSFLILLALFPLVLKQLGSQLPQLAGIIAVISQAVRDPAKTAEEFGEDMGDTILALPAGFFSALAAAGFDAGADIVQPGGAQPFTSTETVYATGVAEPTICDRYEFDLIEIKRKLDGAAGLERIQGTFAWTSKLYDMKKQGCARPGFVTSTTWDRVPG